MRITIITPTLNSAPALAEALQSILAQDFDGEVEHILADGASTDVTLEVARRYLSRYLNRGWQLKILSEPDRGIYDAINRGLVLATGDVVGILHSDDRYDTPRALSLIAEAFDADPTLDAVYADIRYFRPSNPADTVRRYSSRGFRPGLMLMGFQPPHPTLYCRRSLYDRVGHYDHRYRISGDFDFMLRALWQGKARTRRLPVTLVAMATGGTSDRNIGAHLRGLWEHQQAYMRNRVPTCVLCDLPQLIHKLLQLK